MQINSGEIHIWTASLVLTDAQENEQLQLLSTDETERAHRYRFPIHRKRFIASRAMLRNLLGLYLALAPKEIVFAYDEYEKPHLQPASPLQFNLSHSDDIAVYAFTLNYPIGIDIEKIQENYTTGVAERFFSSAENDVLNSLSAKERNIMFYRIWARKEALVKAIGKGLSISLSSFSVPVHNDNKVINIDYFEGWSLLPLTLHPDYESALATNQLIKKVSEWTLNNQTPTLNKVYNL